MGLLDENLTTIDQCDHTPVTPRFLERNGYSNKYSSTSIVILFRSYSSPGFSFAKEHRSTYKRPPGDTIYYSTVVEYNMFTRKYKRTVLCFGHEVPSTNTTSFNIVYQDAGYGIGAWYEGEFSMMDGGIDAFSRRIIEENESRVERITRAYDELKYQ